MTIENLEYDALLEKFKKILRENGLKYTQQREVLLKTLYNNDEHFTPERLYFFIKETYPELNVGIATVYRTLNLLEEAEMEPLSASARKVKNSSSLLSLTTTI